jgi:hypothetical protein
MMNHYHSCWGHAYEFTLGLISLLHEYDTDILSSRDYNLFVLRDVWSKDDLNGQVAPMIIWNNTTVDYIGGSYKNAYTILHKCVSKRRIIFERAMPFKYIHFDTLIYGGNMANQRNILNCVKKYPHRYIEPVASDEQTLQWLGYAKAHLRRYLRLREKVSGLAKSILYIDRKGTRALTNSSRDSLASILGKPPVYMEEMNIAQQIQLFIDADIVVAVHGTALFHLCWSAPETLVLELRGGKSDNAKIFTSYTACLNQRIRQISSSEKGWIPFQAHVNLTEENLAEVRRFSCLELEL